MNRNIQSELRRWGRLLLPVPGFILLAWLVSRLSWPEVKQSLSTADLKYLFIGLVMFVPLMMGRSRHWQLLLGGFGIDAPYWRILRLTVLGFSWGVVTPGQVGDFIKLWYLRRDGFTTQKIFSSIVEKAGKKLAGYRIAKELGLE